MEKLTETHNWVDKATGLDCRLKPGGTKYPWCGYVRVPKDHPLFGKHYGDAVEILQNRLKERLEEPVGDLSKQGFRIKLALLGGKVKASPEDLLQVHGGITFSAAWEEGTWWFGFDTAYYGDKWLPDSDGEFRDIDCCKNECRQLAKQLNDLVKYEQQ